MATQQGSERPTAYCKVCDQFTDGIGPWCKIYVIDRYCEPLRVLRQTIYQADSGGDGPLVNALCQYIRRHAGEEFVP